MNIYWRELKAGTKSFLIWSATMVFLVAAGMLKYSAFAKTGESVNELFNSMPPGLLQAMGIPPGADFSSIGIFYSIFFLYFPAADVGPQLPAGRIDHCQRRNATKPPIFCWSNRSAAAGQSPPKSSPR